MKSPISLSHIIARILVGILVIGLAFYAFNVASRYQNFKDELGGINGIRINNPRSEVMYRLGFPTHVLGPVEQGEWGKMQRVFSTDASIDSLNAMPSNTRAEDYSEWVYEKEDGFNRFTVKFDSSGIVESLNWYSNGSDGFAWGPIAGIRNGDSEEKVLSLGHPTKHFIENTTKNIEYSDIGLKFFLVKGHVYMVTLKRPTKGNKALVLRFFNMAL